MCLKVCMKYPLHLYCDALFLLYFWPAFIVDISAVFFSSLGTCTDTGDSRIYDVVWKFRSCLKPSRCTLDCAITFENASVPLQQLHPWTVTYSVTSLPNMASISVFGTCIVRHLWAFTSFARQTDQSHGTGPGHCVWAYKFLHTVLIFPCAANSSAK